MTARIRAWLLTILRRAYLNTLRRQRPDLIADSRDLDQRRPAFGAALQLVLALRALLTPDQAPR